MEPLPFGQENLRIFTGRLIDKWATQYKDDDKGFRELIAKKIYYHPLHPENHNVRFLSNTNSEFIEIWTGLQWIPYPKSYVLKDVDVAVDTVLTMYRHKKMLMDLLLEIKQFGGMPNAEYVTTLLQKCEEEVQHTERLNEMKRLLGGPNQTVRSIADLVHVELEKVKAGVHQYQMMNARLLHEVA